jgi:hypothetical protein
MGRSFGYPYDFDALPRAVAQIQSRLESFPWDKSRIAIFIDFAADFSSKFEALFKIKPFVLLRKIVDSLDRSTVQIVYLAAPGPWPEPAPFSLPLNILTAGQATEWMADAVKSRPWLQQIRGEEAGLTTSGNWVVELIKRRWRRGETDMVFCSAADFSKLSYAIGFTRHRHAL